MRNLDVLSAHKILSIRSAETLFSQSLDEAKREYRALVRRWHPDNCMEARAQEVFNHIVLLYADAREKAENGKWDEPFEKAEKEVHGAKKFRLDTGAAKTIIYESMRTFELGTMYIAHNAVTFEVGAEFADLFHNARRQIRNLKFENSDMAAEMGRSLPQIQEAFKSGNSYVLTLRKTPDQLLLADVVSHYGNKIQPLEHIGWILNVLWNIACYLQWSRITHNAISLDTVFISPLRHSGMLLGGWWYAAQSGQPLLAVPDRSLQFIPPDIIYGAIADSRADLELVKAVGRELLGDATGVRLTIDDALPSRMTEWLNLPADERAIDNYKEWKEQVLRDCFGAPRFVQMSLNSNDIYKEKR